MTMRASRERPRTPPGQPAGRQAAAKVNTPPPRAATSKHEECLWDATRALLARCATTAHAAATTAARDAAAACTTKAHTEQLHVVRAQACPSGRSSPPPDKHTSLPRVR